MSANSEKTRGFTLIELMITVAIIGILGAIAYPSYMSQMTKSRRADAQRIMTSHAQSMERYFTTNGKYTAAANDCGPDDPVASNFYTYGTVCTDTTFTITATAVAGSSQAADDELTLTNTGTRTPAEKWTN